MNKMVGYKIKDEAFEKWQKLHEKHEDICTLQEFMEYMVGVPTRVFCEYFERKQLPYEKEFKPNYEDSAKICTEIILQNAGDIKLTNLPEVADNYYSEKDMDNAYDKGVEYGKSLRKTISE